MLLYLPVAAAVVAAAALVYLSTAAAEALLYLPVAAAAVAAAVDRLHCSADIPD